MISKAVLDDFGIITQCNTTKDIDKNKIRREREKSCLELKTEQAEKDVTLQVLQYFDRSKDKTLTINNSSDKPVIKNIVEQLILLLQEPGSKYISHVTPTNRKTGNKCIKYYSISQKMN